MATLVEVSRQLGQQGSILQDTNRSIQEMLRVVENQLSFFTRKEAGDRLEKLENERERQRDSRPQSSALPSVNLEGLAGKVASSSSMQDFFRFFTSGFAGFLGGASVAIFKFLKTMLKGGLVITFFPFIKDLADKIGKEIVTLLDSFFEDFVSFKLTEKQKDVVRSALGEGIKTAIISRLFLGTKTSLIAGFIGAAFDAVANLFPDFGEYVEGTYNKVLDWVDNNAGEGGKAAVKFLRNQPELMKTVFSIVGAVIATSLIPAVVKLAGTIIAGIFSLIALPFLGATVIPVGTGLMLKIGGAAILLTAGIAAYRYEEEIREAIQKAMDQLDEAMRGFLQQIFSFGGDLMTGAIDRLRYFVRGVDPTQFDIGTLKQRDRIRENIENLEKEKNDAIEAALKAQGAFPKNPAATTVSEMNKIMEISKPIEERYQQEIDKLNELLNTVERELMKSGGSTPLEFEIPGNILVTKDKFEDMLYKYRTGKAGPVPMAGINAEDITQFLEENKQYQLEKVPGLGNGGNIISGNNSNNSENYYINQNNPQFPLALDIMRYFMLRDFANPPGLRN